MWYAPTSINATGADPVSRLDVSRRLHIDAADDDEDIGLMIETAIDHVERCCGVILRASAVALQCDAFTDFYRLPIGPVSSIVSIAYVDSSAQVQTLSDTIYELLPLGELDSFIGLQVGQTTWPITQPGSRISVMLEAGFDLVPPAIKGAILLHIGDAFENRVPQANAGATAFDNLLCNFRRG